MKLTRFLGIFAVFRGGSDGVSDAELSRAKTSGVRAEIPHSGPSLPYGYSKRVNISPRRKEAMLLCVHVSAGGAAVAVGMG